MGCNCLTILSYFLLYIEVNQPYVYEHPLPLVRPSHTPNPTHQGNHRAPSQVPCAIVQV